MSGLRYVYAVCRPFEAALQAQLGGVAGCPPTAVHHQGLVAVVSTVPAVEFDEGPLRQRLEDRAWLTATARAHEQVIDALTTVTTPLPLPFATVLPDDSAVRVLLETHAAEIRAVLDRLAGRVEWSVRVYAGGERRAEAERLATRLHEELRAAAEETRLHPHRTLKVTETEERAWGGNVLDAAYLVPRRQSGGFVEMVDKAREDLPEGGVRIHLTGPWAPYSFGALGGGG
ncbi:GvpL/GvpF family gas vesicle protein [Streptomyces abyssomicinicus]|uniref:GvpL/GvpF family gas vesicle protein n=1 Tax=Streptomyces abyssomicinicus TaxID=574929 RepID=UPI0012508D32|nr:GvpL/GvpF family gas vesicle protein [Streptomyces abyssomicinicus]